MGHQSDIFVRPRSEELILTFPLKPIAWARTMGGKTKRPFTPPRLQVYYHELMTLAADQLPEGWEPFGEPCELEVFLGKDWSQLRVRIIPEAHRLLMGDVTNYLKAHEDGLQAAHKEVKRGTIWLNDKQIVKASVEEVDVRFEDLPETEEA